MTVASYEFQAVMPDGSLQRGLTQAVSVDAAYAQISQSGMTPIRIRAVEKRRFGYGRTRAVSLREVSVFTYQFSVLIEARIPISEGLRSIAEEETNERLRAVIEQIAASISAGSSITDAMEPFRELFGDVYIQSVHAAEKSGNLVKVLNHLSEMLDREVELRSQVRSALLYPISVVTMLCMAVVFLLTIVVPRFAGMFAERDVALPVPTQILLHISQFVQHGWWILAPVIIGLVISLRLMRFSTSASLKMDQIMHRIPIVRGLLQAAALSRFAHVFGISLSSGLSLIDCLEMSGRASARPMLVRDTDRLAEEVAQGRTLSNVLSSCPYMTGFVRRLLSAGEQSADLPAMCRIIARHYDREVRFLAKNMSALIEPIMVVVLAGVVLFIALAIFLPMWNMMVVVGA